MKLWSQIDELLDDWTSVQALRAHGVQLLAARRARNRGRRVPNELQEDERASAMLALMVPLEVARLRSTLDGPLILLKGADLAARYPDPTLRPYGDIDILVSDAEATQRALIAASYKPQFDEHHWSVKHHRPTLQCPKSFLTVEVHDAPKWIYWHDPPPTDELFATAVASPLAIDGVLSLAPPQYTLALAAHAWSHGPIGRLLHLIDIAIVSEECNAHELRVLANRWQLGALLETTNQAIEAIFNDDPVQNWVLRRWVRHIKNGQERIAIEHFATLWLGGLWAPTPHQRFVAVAHAIQEEFRPFDGVGATVQFRRLMQKSSRALRPASRYYNPP